MRHRRLVVAAGCVIVLGIAGTAWGIAVTTATGGQDVTCHIDDQNVLSCPLPPPSTVTETTTETATETQTVTATETVPGPTTTIPGPTTTVTETVTVTPTPTQPPPPACAAAANTPGGADPYGGCFPGPSNTGVPASIVLTTYTGPTSLPCGTVIDSKTINSSLTIAGTNGTTDPATPCVTIKNSLINGTISNSPTPGATGPLLMTDDEVNAPTTSNKSLLAGSNFYLWRLNIHNGAGAAIACDGYCAIHDSWTHDFYLAGATHYDGVLSNGTHGHPLVVDHDSVGCYFYGTAAGATGACSGDVGLFGDFSAISHVTVNHSLLLASTPVNGPSVGYCLYGGSIPSKAYPVATYVVVTGNVFQRGGSGKCGDYGPVAYWAYNTGDVWSGNVWDNGTTLTP